MAHFVNIVIFGGHPENRHGVDARLGEFGSELNRGERFVKGVRGAAEQTYLLSADYRYRPSFQAMQIFQRGRTGAKNDVLHAQNVRHFFSTLAGVIQLAGHAPDRIHFRTVRVKRGYAAKIVEVIKEEF
jgi:hypothetical protein